MSNETTKTRWAFAEKLSPIRNNPTKGSRRIAALKFWTEHGFRGSYLIRRRWTDPKGQKWLEIRIPMRPNGKTGWVRADVMGRSHVVRKQLVINRANQTATLYRLGKKIWQSRIGVGSSASPTPGGKFWIRERIRVSNPAGAYGPWAFGTSAVASVSDWPMGGIVGIHGTNQPELIPGRPSHGCIRVPNAAITKLATKMPIGTPVRII